MATILTVLSSFSLIVFSLSSPLNVQRINQKIADHQISRRSFEPWLEKFGHDPRFNITKFGIEIPFHLYEMAHLYQSDIKGYGGYIEEDETGQKHFKTNRWIDGVVPYVITGNYSTKEMAVIRSAFKDFEIFTCVKFVPRVNEKDYIDIQSTNDGCWSYVGRRGRNKQPQQVNLMRRICTFKSTVIHELMHVIGFDHEQSRPDRDNYVTVHWGNIETDCVGDFQVEKETFQDVGVPYDIGSVMQYPSSSCSIDFEKPSIEAKNGKKLGNKIGFTKNDIEEINRRYECYKK